MTLRCLCPEPSHTPRWGRSPGAWAPLWGQEALGGTSGGGQRGWRWLQLRERSCRGAEQGEGLAVGRGLGTGLREGSQQPGDCLCFSLFASASGARSPAWDSPPRRAGRGRAAARDMCDSLAPASPFTVTVCFCLLVQ